MNIYMHMHIHIYTHAQHTHTHGGQGRLIKTMPKWYIDNFELKLFEKQLLQEGHSDFPSIPLKVGNKSPMLKVTSLHKDIERYL